MKKGNEINGLRISQKTHRFPKVTFWAGVKWGPKMGAKIGQNEG
jgi:hypothetical protein